MTDAEALAVIEAELRALPRDRLIALQRELGVKADGAVGPNTIRAYGALQEAKQASAAQSRAAELSAQAANTKAESDRIASEAALKKAEEEAAAREHERSPWRQGVQIGAPIVGLAGGAALGHMGARHVGEFHKAGQARRNAELAKLSGEIDRELRRSTPDAARLKGLQSAGRNLDLKTSKGPWAWPYIALALGEAGLARGGGYLMGPGTGQDALYGASSGGVAGAAALAGERAIRRGNEALLPDARHMASLYQLDAQLASPRQASAGIPQPQAPTPPPARPSKSNVAEARKAGVRTAGWYRSKDALRQAMRAKGAVPKFALPLTVGAAGFLGARDARADGRNPLAGAASSAADALLLGAPSAYGMARSGGLSVPAAAGAGVGAMVDTLATGGALQSMLDPGIDPEIKRQAARKLALPPGSPLNAFGGADDPGAAFAAAVLELKRALFGGPKIRPRPYVPADATSSPPVAPPRMRNALAPRRF